MFTWCGRGGQPPAAGSNPYSRPRRALVLAPPRPGGSVQASTSPTEAQAGIEQCPGQASGRGGQGTLAPLLRRVNQCSGPPSAERGPVPPFMRAPAAQAERDRAEGRRAPAVCPIGQCSVPLGVHGRRSPNAVRRGAAGYGRLPAVCRSTEPGPRPCPAPSSVPGPQPDRREQLQDMLGFP
ncbi:hypothetical protein NDU88_001532 [Pleurodeles waltl]|uniref:Uncharacterized protein n=1 Tax=Pleurodeles waltl TaxID=8319 RepID=A0AAV7LXX2_PLEWA|nr:hypothetical protein NDU88_001532 [Pleurodeles waltl]